MDRLNKTELGQFNDERFPKIQNDFENVMKEFLERWKDIDTTDLQAVCLSQIGWLISKHHMMYNMDRLMKEKGYTSSGQAKTVKYIEQIID
jgi:hypothetical protein